MSDFVINTEWMPNAAGEWRVVHARARQYAPGRDLVTMQVPHRTNPDADPISLDVEAPVPEATIGGGLYTLTMVGYESDRGDNGEYTVAAQVWTTAHRDDGGLVGCSLSFHPDTIIVGLPFGHLPLDIMIVVGYGLTSDFPERRIGAAPLFRRA